MITFVFSKRKCRKKCDELFEKINYILEILSQKNIPKELCDDFSNLNENWKEYVESEGWCVYLKKVKELYLKFFIFKNIIDFISYDKDFLELLINLHEIYNDTGIIIREYVSQLLINDIVKDTVRKLNSKSNWDEKIIKSYVKEYLNNALMYLIETWKQEKLIY